MRYRGVEVMAHPQTRRVWRWYWWLPERRTEQKYVLHALPDDSASRAWDGEEGSPIPAPPAPPSLLSVWVDTRAFDTIGKRDGEAVRLAQRYLAQLNTDDRPRRVDVVHAPRDVPAHVTYVPPPPRASVARDGGRL